MPPVSPLPFLAYPLGIILGVSLIIALVLIWKGEGAAIALLLAFLFYLNYQDHLAARKREQDATITQTTTP